MAEPIRLAHTAYALVDGDRRPEPGEVITVALRGATVVQIDATVTSLEIGDDGEEAILVDDTGARWALPIQPLPERSRP
jgi:hypothetical protein